MHPFVANRMTVLLNFSLTAGFTIRFDVIVSGYSIFHNDISYEIKWFKEHRFEKKLYSVLKVKKWEEHIPTYLPEVFSVEKELSDIAKATCQAELVHEIIVGLSFAPILFTFLFGDFWVFFLSSLGAALIDTVFVIVQRYTRPRLIKIIEKD